MRVQSLEIWDDIKMRKEQSKGGRQLVKNGSGPGLVNTH